MKNGLLIAAAILVAVVAGSIYVIVTGLDDLVRSAVQAGGSRATGTAVTLERAEVDIGAGTVVLTGLTIGNPDGFKSEFAIRLGLADVRIDPASLSANPVVVTEVIVQSPDITYEMAPGGSNIDTIGRHARQMAPTGGGGPQSPDEGVTVIIENLYIRGAVVGISAAALGGGTMTSTLPDIHLTGIGAKRGGADPATAAAEIMTALTGRINGYVSVLDLGGVLQGVDNPPAWLQGIVGDGAKKSFEN